MIGHTRRNHLIGLAVAGFSFGASAPAFAADIKDYLGDWSGTLDLGPIKLRFRLAIVNETSANLYNIDQGGGEARASLVQLTIDGLTIEFAGMNLRFVGSLGQSGALETTLSFASGKSYPVVFARGDLFKYAPLTTELLAGIRKSSGAPAMAAACARGGGKATILVDGVRSLDAPAPVTPDDVWCIGSVTKSMTATLVGRLVDAGHVSWDMTVADVLGASIPDMRDGYKRATLHNLLNHRGGVQREIDQKDYDSFSLDGLDDPRAERLRWAGLALMQPPLGAPGEKTSYANSGYVVVGAMLEALLDQPWEALMRDAVFAPLGLTSAGFGAPGIPGKLDQPLGHSVSPTNPDQLVPAGLGSGNAVATPVAKAPAGRVHISMRDLVAFLNAHLLRPPEFLRPATWNMLHTPPEGSDYAMGWEVRTNGRLGHNGSNGFWWAQVAIDPTAQTVAAVAANDGDGAKMAGAAGHLLEGALLLAGR